MEYSICNGEDKVGVARVSREGLYYRIQCTCGLGSVPYRITARAEHQIDLGMCVPNGDTVSLEVRIPMKKLGKGNLSFYIETPNEKQQENWYPISLEKPFPHIAKLKQAYMVSSNGKVGNAFIEGNQSQGPQDNGRIP